MYVVEANGVGAYYVEKDTAHHAYLGEAAIKQQDWFTAVEELTKETRAYPDNELAWQSLASAYINTSNFQQAINAANESLRCRHKMRLPFITWVWRI